MKLHELKPAKGAVKAKKRLGRGTATGLKEVSLIYSKNNIQKLTLNF